MSYLFPTKKDFLGSLRRAPPPKGRLNRSRWVKKYGNGNEVFDGGKWQYNSLNPSASMRKKFNLGSSTVLKRNIGPITAILPPLPLIPTQFQQNQKKQDKRGEMVNDFALDRLEDLMPYPGSEWNAQGLEVRNQRLNKNRKFITRYIDYITTVEGAKAVPNSLRIANSEFIDNYENETTVKPPGGTSFSARRKVSFAA